MKILFLLDITNDKSEITVPNGRALTRCLTSPAGL